MLKISGRRGAVALLVAGLLGVSACSSVSAARHHRYRVVHRRTHVYSVYSRGYEQSLGGIRLGDSVNMLIHRYGNPSEVQLERIMLTTAGGTGGGGIGGGGGLGSGTKTVPVKIFIGPSSAAPGGQGGPAGGTGAGGGQGGGLGLGGGLAGALGSLGVGSLFQNDGGYPGAGGGYPGAGGGYPGAGGGGNTGGQASGTLITPDHPEVKYIYDEPNADSMEFILSPTGRVEQIRATGYTGFVRTGRGVTLGEKYSQVVLAYGYPENQQYSGTGDEILTTDYTNEAHCSFQFYNQRLVGITIAQVD